MLDSAMVEHRTKEIMQIEIMQELGQEIPTLVQLDEKSLVEAILR
jgi:hypothetical protein